MAVEIKVPALGESITEGRIARWLKPDGAAVKADEPVFELETDKASTEVVSPADGILRVLAAEGQTVQVGAVVARVEGSAGAGRAPAAGAKEPAAAPAPNANGPQAPAAADKVLSPAARRLAEEEHIDPASLTGTGRGGRVTKEDVLAAQARSAEARPAAAASAPTPAPAPPAPPAPAVSPPAPQVSTPAKPPTAPAGPSGQGRETRQRVTSIRKRIAERLVQSQQTTATLTTFNEADLSALTELRTRYKDRFKEKHGVGLGFMSFFVKAAVEALKAFPVVNARLDGDDLVYQHFYDIGVAVSTEKGLMVPVLRDADRLGFADIEKRIIDLAVRARDGKINVADLQGGTFTITNGGIFGSLLSTPILNPPQCAILGMHAIQKRPVVINDQVAVRPMMYLALSYDHRLIDGREAVQFLVRIKECVEDPGRLLLQV